MTPDRRSPLRLTRHLRRADIVRMALPPLKGPFTVDTYQRLGELGILGEDDRVELIDGQVVEMSPIGDRHASCVRRLNGLFARQLLDVAVIDVQNPVVLGRRRSPIPRSRMTATSSSPSTPASAFRRPGSWTSNEIVFRCAASPRAAATPASARCPAGTRSHRSDFRP